MKKNIWIMAVAFACVTSVEGEDRQCADQDNPDIIRAEYDWIDPEVMKEIKSIKIGSTRGELLKLFAPVGGLSSPDEGRFFYRKNREIQINVTFECTKNERGASVFSNQDKILGISEPYLSATFPMD